MSDNSGARALITGITGQDGAYLARFLLGKGYAVFGALRSSSPGALWRLTELGIAEQVQLVQFDLTDYAGIEDAVRQVRPTEIYNLAAQSFVGSSFNRPLHVGEVNGMAVIRILEAIRQIDSSIKLYQASTSELFGIAQTIPQHEGTPFHPRSPYGVAKLYGHYSVINYREHYGLFACSGILYNHESPLRGQEFVTRKITLGLARIKLGQQEVLELGNLEAQRDWGYAAEYVEGMWRMLQQEKAEDFVLATGRAHSVQTFVAHSAEVAGLRLEWEGKGVELHALDRDSGKVIVRVNPQFYRPAEAHQLVGDPARAHRVLDWRTTVNLAALCQLMVQADLERLMNGTLSG